MNTLVISPKQNIIQEIIPRLESEGADYSSNLVVFPGKRPSHFLRKALAEKEGKSFIPPIVFSIDEFIDYMYEQIQVEKRRKMESIDAAAILSDIQKKASKPIGGKDFIAPDVFFPIGLEIYHALEELHIEGIDICKVKEIESFTNKAVPEKGLERLESLSFFYNEFYKTVAREGFSTRAVRYKTVSENIDEIKNRGFNQIIFAGFYAFTNCEKELFKKLLARNNTFFIFQNGAGLKERLKDLGISIQDVETDTVDSKINFYSSPDAHGQVYALSRIFETRLKDKKDLDEKTVIVLPSSETLFPLMRQGLSIIDEKDYNISLGYPIYRTPLFGFLNSLMKLIISIDEDKRIYIPDYLKFILHPYAKNIYYKGSAEITRIMFHTLEEEFAKYKEKTFLTLSEIEENKDFIKNVGNRISESAGVIDEDEIKRHLQRIHQNTIEKFLEFKDVKDFTEKCRDVIAYIFNNSTARLHRLFHPFLEAFILQLNAVSKSLMKDASFKERNSYFRFFKKYIMNANVPFEGAPLKGLQVLGLLETRNLKFDTVFIMDVNEGVLPPSKKEDAFLSLKTRELLELPTYHDRDKLAEYYFETILKGAKEAHLFFIEDDKKERSRFVEKLIWRMQRQEKTIENNYIKTIQYKVNLENKTAECIPKNEGMVRFLKDLVYSATSLDMYLKCQLKFYYSYILKLGKKKEVSGDIEKTGIGSVVHEILSRYFSKLKNRRLKEGDINLKEIESYADEIFKEKYGENHHGAVYLLKKQIKNHLNDFLKSYYIPMIKETTVKILEVEKDIPSVFLDSFKIKGRPDIVEKRGEKIFIIDFKTGANKNYLKINFNKLEPDDRDSWHSAIGSFQLPIYLMLYSIYTKTKIDKLDAMFLLLGCSAINKEIELSFCDAADDMERNYEMLKDIILRLLNEITDINMPFKSTDDKKQLCPNCDFQRICGTQWIGKR